MNRAGQVSRVIELYSTAEAMDRAEDVAAGRIATSVGISILLMIVLVFALSRILTRPLRRLAKGVRRVARGELDQGIDIHSNNESGGGGAGHGLR